MNVCRSREMLHPVLADRVRQIESEVIARHNMPIRLFETGRTLARQRQLIKRGRDTTMVSAHVYVPFRYEMVCAVDFVFYDQAWSWNLRDQRVKRWYQLFGRLVSDLCPDLTWAGDNVYQQDYTHFEMPVSRYNWREALKKYLPVIDFEG